METFLDCVTNISLFETAVHFYSNSSRKPHVCLDAFTIILYFTLPSPMNMKFPSTKISLWFCEMACDWNAANICSVTILFYPLTSFVGSNGPLIHPVPTSHRLERAMCLLPTVSQLISLSLLPSILYLFQTSSHTFYLLSYTNCYTDLVTFVSVFNQHVNNWKLVF